MKFYGKAQEAADRIIDAFKTGSVPEMLAPMFINRTDDIPCLKWSWGNRLSAAIFGHFDARGFKQWKAVGRHVKKGEKAFDILAPMTKKVTAKNDSGEEETRMIVYGFKSIPVFGYRQTEGKPLAYDETTQRQLDALPFKEVAESWDLTIEVRSANTMQKGCRGYYTKGESITVGVANKLTWAHELIHAADDRLGNLTEEGQHWRSETVAQLGAAILLTLAGEESTDLGFVWKYIETYAVRSGIEPISACMMVLNRACDAVTLILETAEELADKMATC